MAFFLELLLIMSIGMFPLLLAVGGSIYRSISAATRPAYAQ
jgi:hypothetical protein